MRKKIVVTLLATLLPAVAVAQTYDAAVINEPGKVGAARKLTLNATIKSVDASTRAVTLTGPEGRDVTVIAGPEVANFAQLRAGDTVSIELVEAVLLELRKAGSSVPPQRTDQAGVETARPGAAPGAVGGRMTSVTGEVIAVDAGRQSITVRGPQRTVDLPIRDPEQFKRIAVGDRLEATYVEAAAVSVVPKK
jgi:hypothetical protein